MGSRNVTMVDWIRCILMIGGILGVLVIIMSYPILVPFALMAMVWGLALKDS